MPPITWTDLRGRGLGDLLADSGYSCLEFTMEWGAVLAWNLTIAALLHCAAEQAVDAERDAHDMRGDDA